MSQKKSGFQDRAGQQLMFYFLAEPRLCSLFSDLIVSHLKISYVLVLWKLTSFVTD